MVDIIRNEIFRDAIRKHRHLVGALPLVCDFCRWSEKVHGLFFNLPPAPGEFNEYLTLGEIEMTRRLYDPRNFGSYNVGDAPQLLHFQYKGSEDVHRYVLVERIPFGEMNKNTHRKVGESGTAGDIAHGYMQKNDACKAKKVAVKKAKKKKAVKK